MSFPKKAIVDYFKEKFPVGAKVELLKMDDPQAPPIGTMGNVLYVDDTATVHVAWDSGSCLGAVYDEDIIKIVEE